MRKKLSIFIVIACIATLTAVPIYATDTSINDPNSSESLSVEEQKEVLGNLTDENIKAVIPNSHGEKNVQEILNAEEVDNNLLKKISNEGDVEVEQIDAKNIELTIDLDEPTNTTLYNNGAKVEEKELIGMVIENESDLSTEEYVNQMKKTIENTDAAMTSSVKLSFIEPAYAYDETAHEITTTGPTSKIKLKKRIIYYFASKGGGPSLQNWYKIIRSSSKIVSTTYKVKTLKMSSSYSGYASSTVNDFKKAGWIKGSKNGSTISSPQKGKYYKLASATPKWFNEHYGFKYSTKTVMQYVKNGATKTSTYQITFNR